MLVSEHAEMYYQNTWSRFVSHTPGWLHVLIQILKTQHTKRVTIFASTWSWLYELTPGQVLSSIHIVRCIHCFHHWVTLQPMAAYSPLVNLPLSGRLDQRLMEKVFSLLHAPNKFPRVFWKLPANCITGFPQKSENRIPWLFHDWFASFHDSHSHMVSDMVMTVSQHARQSQTRKLP